MLVLDSWLQYKVAKIFPEQVGSVSTLGDSTCVISAMDKNAVSFNPFMHVRISECVPDAETRNPIKILVVKSAYCNLLIISAMEQSHTYDEAVHKLKKLSRSQGRMAMTISLNGQAMPSYDSGEASGTIILSNYPEAMQRASQLLFKDAT